jgi:hypothetical protein
MIADALRQVGMNFVDALATFLPRMLMTISIVLAGWLIAMAVRVLVRRVLQGVRFNAASERAGIAAVLKNAELPPAESLATSIAFWLVWVGFLLSGVDVLGFTTLRGLIDGLAGFIPRLLVSVAIVVVGFFAANLSWRATLLAAVNARVPSPRLLAGAVRSLILILAGAMALEQVAVARTIVLTAFAISFGAVMLGLAIAFGVGGGGIARRILEHQFPERERSGIDDLPHL